MEGKVVESWCVVVFLGGRGCVGGCAMSMQRCTIHVGGLVGCLFPYIDSFACGCLCFDMFCVGFHQDVPMIR